MGDMKLFVLGGLSAFFCLHRPGVEAVAFNEVGQLGHAHLASRSSGSCPSSLDSFFGKATKHFLTGAPPGLQAALPPLIPVCFVNGH